MATKGKKAVLGKKRTLDETNPSDEVGQVIKKAKKQAPVNNNKATKKIKDTELDELNGSNHDQDWANNDSDSELSISDANMNGTGDDDFQLGNLEIRVDRKTKQTVDEKLQKLQNKKQAKSNSDEEEAADDDGRGVIYIGHLPFGFFEQQLKGFFAQFGTVTRLRVSRNPKTGRSRHYGFVEFLDREVAAIAADTMDGYMMYGKRLVSKLMEPKDVKPNLFLGANRRLGLRPAPTRLQARREYNKPKTAEQIDRNIAKLLKAEEKKRAKLKELGIDYDFPGFAAQADKVPKKIQFGYESDSESSDEEPEQEVKAVKTPVKTPAKAEKSPVATPAKKTQEKSPAKSPAKSPVKSQESTPAKATNGQAKTPVKTPAKGATPAKAEKKSPATTPAKGVTPAKTEKKSPAVTPAKESSEKKTPATTPAKKSAAVATPVKESTPAKAEKKTPATTPAKESAKTPVKTPNKSPAKNGADLKKTPAKTPVKTPVKSPKGSK